MRLNRTSWAAVLGGFAPLALPHWGLRTRLEASWTLVCWERITVLYNCGLPLYCKQVAIGSEHLGCICDHVQCII